MGFSPASALIILALHLAGMNLYLLFLRMFLSLHEEHCKDKNCSLANMNNIRAYTQAVLWPIYTLKWLAISKGLL